MNIAGLAQLINYLLLASGRKKIGKTLNSDERY